MINAPIGSRLLFYGFAAVVSGGVAYVIVRIVANGSDASHTIASRTGAVYAGISGIGAIINEIVIATRPATP